MGEHIPLVNRSETVQGVTLTFLSIAVVAVSLRLYVRITTPKLVGWDDLFVVLSAACALTGSIITCLMPSVGMGKHLNTLSFQQLTFFFKYVFASNLTYATSTTFIKLAILFQYLRLFDMRSPAARRITLGMIGVVSVWGLTFSLLILLSCIPIQKNWDIMRQGKCRAFGVKGVAEGNELFASFAAHAGSNMLLDIVIWVLPIPFLRSLRMGGKTRVGMITLFIMGAVVSILSVVRMFAISINRVGTVPTFDVTFHTPSIYIFSILEVNVAILCASIPIFWPLVSAFAANKILVVNEIEVHSTQHSEEMGLNKIRSNEAGIGIGLSMPAGMDVEIAGGEDNGGRTSRMSGIMGLGRSNDHGNKTEKTPHRTLSFNRLRQTRSNTDEPLPSLHLFPQSAHVNNSPPRQYRHHRLSSTNYHTHHHHGFTSAPRISHESQRNLNRSSRNVSRSSGHSRTGSSPELDPFKGRTRSSSRNSFGRELEWGIDEGVKEKGEKVEEERGRGRDRRISGGLGEKRVPFDWVEGREK
ncbi:hypothetical protein GQ43DRAFT_477437 [Delitschia confertaspora ATCC 74209]|uniref:Rhodopsin domain-containing protein n=1 Tax=Delitschia confertaspora ATCC 74209 TaxID=1513339 RepID=A0A9P4JTN9_9PLEO|nr:hypothetical protein GQ43DRAFT_477437 [Delitschia confertaspora ATCC 74209]